MLIVVVISSGSANEVGPMSIPFCVGLVSSANNYMYLPHPTNSFRLFYGLAHYVFTDIPEPLEACLPQTPIVRCVFCCWLVVEVCLETRRTVSIGRYRD